jgi:iron complex outermembrane receptor protein
VTLNWRLSDSFDLFGARGVTLGLEARNIFNTDPPYVNSRQGQNSGGGYDPTVTNPVGRLFALSLRVRY